MQREHIRETSFLSACFLLSLILVSICFPNLDVHASQAWGGVGPVEEHATPICMNCSLGTYPLALVGKRRPGSFRRSNNQYGTHYFQSPSAIPLEKRQGWYKNTMVSLNTASYGITNALSVTGGIDLVSVISSKENGPVFTARAQVSGSPSKIFHIGVTAFYLRTRVPTAQTEVGELKKAPGFVAGMGQITIGNIDNQITLSGGVIHDGSDFARGPVFSIAGAVRAFPNVSVVTEHYIITDPDRSFYVHSLGVRIIGEHLAIDLGLAYDAEFTVRVTPIGLPFVAATLNL
ncbi:MAG: hypothetical protein KBF87_03485 [Flavobacteriales bacterium]|nr:hypothetical protein [Flavobacteriales bacterium]HQX30652.1 hypothetical protein [Flavobacteriales bacterium]HQZ93865.1 hypothetical protein [Flavobacteriales bacterium]